MRSPSSSPNSIPKRRRCSSSTASSAKRWRAEFVAMGKAQGGGSGWVLLTYLHRDGCLVNQWAADHTCAVAGATPILALDMYEHSYHLDYGTKAAAYVDAFYGQHRLAARGGTHRPRYRRRVMTTRARTGGLP